MKRNVVYAGILTLIALCILTSGCERISCIEGNSDLQWETRTIDDFTSLVSEGIFDVTIIQDTFTSLEIQAESNLLPYFSTRTEDGVLTIEEREQRCIDNNYPVRVIVHTTELKEVSLDGSGEIIANDIETNEMDIRLSGSGDIYLGLDSCVYLSGKITGSGNIYINGKNTESELKIAGTGNIHASDLEQETVFANISGAGNMYLWVTDFLDVNISGSGNIYYKGNPTINITITGSGSLINN